MTIIQFHVLVPRAESAHVAEVFQAALDKIVATGELGSGTVVTVPDPNLSQRPGGVEEQLRRIYREEHDDRDLEDAQVYRYDLSLEGVQGSINQLAMVLSRLLTPHAVLPKDHVLLEDELSYERPAIFPWTVDIIR